MADTTKVKVTKDWVKLSDGDCTVQANSSEQFQFAVTASNPKDDGLILIINEPVNLSYGTAVWCRLPSSQAGNKSVDVTVIK